MKKQPARVNYFFKGGYVELWETIKDTFYNVGCDIADAWEAVVESFVAFWESFGPGFASIISFEFEWDEIWDSIKEICVFAFSLGKLLCILFITTTLCIFFSAAHVVILLSIMAVAYIFFLFMLVSDIIYRAVKKIATHCPACQNRFALPVYHCPSCGVEHDSLKPSRYGIWKRRCECGKKIPTTFFNGRGKLDCNCPVCGMGITDGGRHVNVCIPVIGGASSGKTCFITQAISGVERFAQGNKMDFEYYSTGMDDYADNQADMANGRTPQKTQDLRMKYYDFYLTPSNVKLKNLISLCDVGGEVYKDSETLGQQIGYKNADSFLMIIDPLSISMYRDELKKTMDPTKYRYSADHLDEILSMLISTLENMFCKGSKNMLKKDIAIVFTKGDIPGLADKIGTPAVAKYMSEHENVSRFEAQNAVCEAFLMEYEEVNFLNTMKSKFRTIQFFCSSALGHNENGTKFKPENVEEPLLWLADKCCASIDLKDVWGKKL